MIPWLKNAITLGYISLLKVENAGTRARPICEIMRGSRTFICSKACATFSVTACKAFGGHDGRGDDVWKRQSSATTDARTAIQRARSSETKTWFFRLGDGDRDFLPPL